MTRFKIEVYRVGHKNELAFSDYISEEQFFDILIEGLRLDYSEAKEFVWFQRSKEKVKP